MNILNKPTIIVAIALLLWFTAAGTGFCKPPAASAGHMQKGIELAQQKQYDAARPGYAALVKDPDMGDFAQYKIFLPERPDGKPWELRLQLSKEPDVPKKETPKPE